MAGAFISHGWLAAVIPAHARRFRVHDAALRYTLERAGAELAADDADVEIAPLDEVAGVAPTVIVPLNANIADSRARVRQVVRRVAASAEVRIRAAHACAALGRRGYSHVHAIPWDRDQPIHLGDHVPSAHRFAERFPRRVLIVGSRGAPERTVLQQVLHAAGDGAAAALHGLRPIVASGTLVVLTSAHVVRIAMGPAAGLVEEQGEALRNLAAAAPPDVVASRVPRLLATEREGLARWSLEERVRGDHPPTSLGGALAADCLDFLVALYQARPARGVPPAAHAARQGEIVATYAPASGSAVRELAQQIDEEVGGLRTGFWHGDFWMNNLLVDGHRLVGVIDWAQGGAHGLPLLDLLNLELIDAIDPSVYDWGPAIAEYLLPRAVRGPTRRHLEYLRRIGLDLSAREHRSLVAAYWLERVSHHLRVFVDRGRDPLWLHRNVTQVVPALARASLRLPRHRRAPAERAVRMTST